MQAPKINKSSDGAKPNNHLIRKPLVQKKDVKTPGVNATAHTSILGRKVIFGSKGSQAKLKVGSPNDKFEKEADSVADTVVNKTAEPSVQKAPAPPIQTMKVSSTDLQRMSQPDEEVQMMSDEEAASSDQEIQTKALSIQKMAAGSEDDDSNVQMKSEEEESVQMMSDDDSEVQTKSEEEESVQMMSDDDSEVQMKSEEEESVQMMSDDDSEVQMKSEEEESVQMKESGTDEDESVQLMSDEEAASSDQEIQTKLTNEPTAAPLDVSSTLKSSKGAGQPLDPDTKSTMESGFGHDLSDVKIHTDSRATDMNKSLGARAFTNGADIFFNEGEYRPDTPQGQVLLAHELTHTLQQGAVDKKLTPEQEEENKEEETPENAEKEAAAEGENAEGEEKEGAAGEEEVEEPEFAQSTGNPLDAWMEGQSEMAQIEPLAEEEEAEKEPINPLEDPDFIGVTNAISDEAEEQADHDPAEALSMEAQEAAESPDSEADSFAQVEQVDEMEAQEPKEFDAATFKAMLMKRIEEMQLPENNEEADDFENNNNIDEVNKASMGDVAAEKDKAGGAIEQSTEKEPTVKAQHKREAKPLPEAKRGGKPKSVNAEAAVPKPRPDTEVGEPLKNDAAKMDHAMAENEVTDHQLEISEEPSFHQALTSKSEAKTNAETAPQTFREQESSAINNNAEASKQKSQEELQGMQVLNNDAVSSVVGDQKATGDKDTSERGRIAGEINAIYEKTKTDVTGILTELDTKVEKMFSAASTKAKAAFEAYCAREMYLYKKRRYSGVLGKGRWIKDLFADLPAEVNQFYVDGRKIFVDIMDKEIDKIAHVVATDLNSATQRIEKGKQEVNDYVEELPSNLKKFGKEAASDIQDKFEELSEEVNSKQEDLVDMLAEEYVATLEEVDERIEEMKAANRGLISQAMDFIDGVIETIRKLKEAIMGLLSAISSAISVIMADPIGFMGTLFDGISKGIDMFKANIQNHLMGGLLEWLTGAMGPMGIQIPADIFSLSGIFSLVMQVLGLGWSTLRMKAVKSMGEPVVTALEGSYDMFKTFSTKGVMGIWEYVKDKFTDLKETVMGAIKDMLITKVIEAGIKWLLSLLIPGAGFIKAIMAIKDIIVFFVESAIMLIPAITEAILALAAGSVAGVSKAIEFGLAKLITLVIGLFARLIGLGGLAKKVTKIFKKIRKRIGRAINKLMQKAKRAGRKIMRKLGIGKKKDKKGKEERSKKEMEADLKAAKKEAEVHLKKPDASPEDLKKKKLPKIKNKYDLKEVKLVHEKEDKYHVHLSVNPETDTATDQLDGVDESTVKVGQQISAKYGDRNHTATVKKVDEEKNEINFQFNYENLKERDQTYTFEKFDQLVKKGEINLAPGKEHTEYKPDKTSVKTRIKDGKFILSYDYLPLKEGEVPPSFTATISIDEGELFTHTVNGYRLAVKVSGTRGINTAESSNQLGTHRAHLIADWFKGSGYKNALNIINTSSEYNTGPMYTAEKKIVAEARKIAEDHPDKQVTFNMEVIAEYTILTDQTTLEAFKSHLQKGETDDLYSILKNNKDPRQTQNVDYIADGFKADGKDIEGFADANAGVDKWI